MRKFWLKIAKKIQISYKCVQNYLSHVTFHTHTFYIVTFFLAEKEQLDVHNIRQEFFSVVFFNNSLGQWESRWWKEQKEKSRGIRRRIIYANQQRLIITELKNIFGPFFAVWSSTRLKLPISFLHVLWNKKSKKFFSSDSFVWLRLMITKRISYLTCWKWIKSSWNQQKGQKRDLYGHDAFLDFRHKKRLCKE